MNTKPFERLSILVTVVLVVVVVAACAIHLRDDESDSSSITSADETNPLATKLAECRSVNYEQKDALSECRKAWAERRHQLLGQKAPSASPDKGASQEGAPLFIEPKDRGRPSPGSSPIPQSEKE